ncbi:unnamed protein product [Ambrosiozyma monospora]|uniref:Unnamed protein product n=1 Tax=Ambrosiozyma monospora TaxID=43982 RepID=A0ACB5TPM6_AMBMO|nr:unnamed protein product [Ambrosiozyma monospora]
MVWVTIVENCDGACYTTEVTCVANTCTCDKFSTIVEVSTYTTTITVPATTSTSVNVIETTVSTVDIVGSPSAVVSVYTITVLVSYSATVVTETCVPGGYAVTITSASTITSPAGGEGGNGGNGGVPTTLTTSIKTIPTKYPTTYISGSVVDTMVSNVNLSLLHVPTQFVRIMTSLLL